MWYSSDPEVLRQHGVKLGNPVALGGSIDLNNANKVSIGSYVVLGTDSMVLTHGPIRPYEERIEAVIEDYVWTGFRCIILPGVTIGKASVIGAGSVVTSDIPPFHVAAGNPAKVIRKLTEEEVIRTYAVRWIIGATLGVGAPDFSRITQVDKEELLYEY